MVGEYWDRKKSCCEILKSKDAVEKIWKPKTVAGKYRRDVLLGEVVDIVWRLLFDDNIWLENIEIKRKCSGESGDKKEKE